MNNETVSDIASQIISETYEAYIEVYSCFGSGTVIIYATLLHFPDELEYIWGQKFTLPTYLYLLCKYPTFFSFLLTIIAELLPTISESLRNDLAGILVQVIQLFAFWGVQGLISVRTYALCQGYRPVAAALFVMTLIVSISRIYAIAAPNCNSCPSLSKSVATAILLDTIVIILLDVLAFIAVIYQIWGLWKLKRGLKIQSNEDLATSLLRQGILRFSFVLLLTTAQLIIIIAAPDFDDSFGPIQNGLSTILMCEFTLDLRKRNAIKAVPSQSAMDLPALSFREHPAQSVRFVLGNLHDNLVAEMGERNDGGISSSDSGEPDTLQESLDGPDSDNREDRVQVV